MTTFTLQDLSNALPTTPEEDEAFKQMENIGMREMFAGMGQDLTAQQEIAHHEAVKQIEGVLHTRHATTPQPSAEVLHNSQVSPEAVIDEMLFTIKQSLLLLATVISQSKAQPDTTPPEGDQPSLQETVALVLQQSDWFKDMVAQHLKDMGVDDIAESVVENLVERDVDHYFSNSFDPTDHFDFNDAVQDAVSDQIDDIVSDKMEDAVDAYLSGATISINK
jgi:hypothetical protein